MQFELLVDDELITRENGGMEEMGEYFLYHDFQGENLLQIYGLQWDAPEKHKTIFYKRALLDMGVQRASLAYLHWSVEEGSFWSR